MHGAFLQCAVSLALLVTAVPAAEAGPGAADPQSSAPAGASNSSGDLVKRLQRKQITEKPAHELFRSASWERPVKPVAAPAPQPIAPPVPYAFMGKMTPQGRSVIIFLTKGGGDQIYSVTAAGEVLDGIYRIDEVATNRIALTYLPLNTKQILSFGAGATTFPERVAPAQPASPSVPIATRDVISAGPARPPQVRDDRPSAPAAAGIAAQPPNESGTSAPTGGAIRDPQ